MWLSCQAGHCFQAIGASHFQDQTALKSALTEMMEDLPLILVAFHGFVKWRTNKFYYHQCARVYGVVWKRAVLHKYKYRIFPFKKTHGIQHMWTTTLKVERERSCEKASNGGKGKCAGLNVLSCENANQSQSHGCACWGKMTMKSETAVSIIACVIWRKLKCIYILKREELFSELKSEVVRWFAGLFWKLNGNKGISVSATLSAVCSVSSSISELLQRSENRTIRGMAFLIQSSILLVSVSRRIVM